MSQSPSSAPCFTGTGVRIAVIMLATLTTNFAAYPNQIWRFPSQIHQISTISTPRLHMVPVKALYAQWRLVRQLWMVAFAPTLLEKAGGEMDISSEKGTRHQRGNATAELPVVLFIVFMGLAFPLIDLVTAGIRYAVLVSATRMAAERAGRAHSFTEARSLVSDWVDRYQSSFSGIKIDTIGVQIVAISKENPKDVQIKPGPLQPAEDLEDNVYEIEVSIKGKIDPLMRIPMLHVAGLSDPLVITATSRNVVEDPNDLKI